MYTVLVLLNGKTVDERKFKFGKWKEIGWWLDDYFYIDPKYEVRIGFSG